MTKRSECFSSHFVFSIVTCNIVLECVHAKKTVSAVQATAFCIGVLPELFYKAQS